MANKENREVEIVAIEEVTMEIDSRTTTIRGPRIGVETIAKTNTTTLAIRGVHPTLPTIKQGRAIIPRSTLRCQNRRLI